MDHYAIVEIDDGLTVVPLPSGGDAEEAARQHGGLLVDPGPYASYDEAYEALLALPADDEEEEA